MPDISDWNVNNIITLKNVFFNCSSLISLPDISKWNIFNPNINASYFYYMNIFNNEDEDEYNDIQKIFGSPSFIGKSYDATLLFQDISYQLFKPEPSNIKNKKKNYCDIAFSMNCLFAGCSSLKELPNISKWKITNANNISGLFLDCSSLTYLPDISIWDTSNIENISNLFYGCSSLISLPDISKWNINKVNNMRGLFYGCSSIEFLPDISKWNINSTSKLKKFIKEYSSSKNNSNTKNFKIKLVKWIYNNMIIDMSYLFYRCSSLKELPDISKWDTTYIRIMNCLFCGCSLLKELPDISKWNMKNVEDISYMFYLCSSLKELPDISKWNTEKINNLNSIFENCSSLTFIPNISKWKLNNNIKINNIFRGCASLVSIPDISKWNINIPEELKNSYLNPISIKENKSNSKISEDVIKNFNSPNDSSSLKDNNSI